MENSKKHPNHLKKVKLVQDIVQQNYIEGVTTYKGIWRKYVNPIYPMCYHTFINYINTAVPKNKEIEQLRLFDEMDT